MSNQEIALKIYNTYREKCHEIGVAPEADLEQIENIVFKARYTITEMLNENKGDNPYVVIRIDDRFSHIAQLVNGNVHIGVVESNALLETLEEEENADVPQDYS